MISINTFEVLLFLAAYALILTVILWRMSAAEERSWRHISEHVSDIAERLNMATNDIQEIGLMTEATPDEITKLQTQVAALEGFKDRATTAIRDMKAELDGVNEYLALVREQQKILDDKIASRPPPLKKSLMPAGAKKLLRKTSRQIRRLS